MLCHDKKKKRQRLKEYINYKLNKYYTVIFTLIIWDFLSFLIYLLIYFLLICLMSSIQILTIFVPHCPPATAGPISQVNTNSGQEPIVLSHYIHNVLCTQKEKLLYCIVVTVLVIREVWKMILKPSRRCDTWGKLLLSKPPPPDGWGTTGSPAPPVDTPSCDRTRSAEAPARRVSRHTGCWAQHFKSSAVASTSLFITQRLLFMNAKNDRKKRPHFKTMQLVATN